MKIFNIIIIFLIILPKAIFGDEYHYVNVLVGDRAATMGGSYKAISDDSTGCYYNPSGIAYAEGDSLTGSGNTYFLEEKTYENWIEGNNLEESGSSFIANYFSIIKKFGEYSTCFSVVAPDTTFLDQETRIANATDSNKSYYLSKYIEDITYLMGPSIGFQISDDLSLGLTLYLYTREAKSSRANYVYMNDSTEGGTAEIQLYTVKSFNEIAYKTIFGVQYKIIEKIVVGLTFDTTNVQYSEFKSDDFVINTGTMYWSEKSYKSTTKGKFPNHLGFGATYYMSPSILYSLDFDYYSAINNKPSFMSATTNEDFKKGIKSNSVLNYSIANETFIDAENAIRFGYFTNNSNAPNSLSESNNMPYEKTDIQGITLGYTSYSQTSSLTGGILYKEGKGFYVDKINSGNTKYTNLTFIFAAGTNF